MAPFHMRTQRLAWMGWGDQNHRWVMQNTPFITIFINIHNYSAPEPPYWGAAISLSSSYSAQNSHLNKTQHLVLTYPRHHLNKWDLTKPVRLKLTRWIQHVLDNKGNVSYITYRQAARGWQKPQQQPLISLKEGGSQRDWPGAVWLRQWANVESNKKLRQ